MLRQLADGHLVSLLGSGTVDGGGRVYLERGENATGTGTRSVAWTSLPERPPSVGMSVSARRTGVVGGLPSVMVGWGYKSMLAACKGNVRTTLATRPERCSMLRRVLLSCWIRRGYRVRKRCKCRGPSNSAVFGSAGVVSFWLGRAASSRDPVAGCGVRHKDKYSWCCTQRPQAREFDAIKIRSDQQSQEARPPFRRGIATDGRSSSSL